MKRGKNNSALRDSINENMIMKLSNDAFIKKNINKRCRSLVIAGDGVRIGAIVNKIALFSTPINYLKPETINQVLSNMVVKEMIAHNIN